MKKRKKIFGYNRGFSFLCHLKSLEYFKSIEYELMELWNTETNIKVSQKFYNILETAAPNVFTEVMKVTNQTSLWYIKLAWFFECYLPNLHLWLGIQLQNQWY